MNIFATSYDPREAAKDLPDKLIVKMVLESAQMLSIAGNKVISGLDQTKIYKTTAYTKHPCTLWAGRSLTNFIWLIEHSLEIGKEYNRRYKKHHKSLDVIMYIKNCLLTNLGEVCYALEQQKSVTPFALAMPDKYQDPVNPCESYRQYMQAEKSYYSKWTPPGEKPKWWTAKTNIT